MDQQSKVPDSFAESVTLMARLRAPGGCPWDREQTLATIRKYTLEEVYEVIDAIDREHWADLREELGDLQLQILFYAQIAADEDQFTIADVLDTLNRKLIRRHPHVFGDEAAAAAGNLALLQKPGAETPAEVLRNWDAIKRAEKSAAGIGQESLLDAVPRSFPALLEASKLGSKAAKVGFDWPDVHGILAKLHEETAEVEAELAKGTQDSARVEEEIGDLLFTVANLARHLKVDPELALRSANAKFRRRFGSMEEGTTEPLDALTADQLEALWAAAKSVEKVPGKPLSS
jgi:MazG family protein